MEELIDFTKQLGLSQEGDIKNGKYVITLKDSNEYSKIYTLLDKSLLVDLVVDKIVLDADVTVIYYSSENFEVELKADFTNDVYTVSVYEI